MSLSGIKTEEINRNNNMEYYKHTDIPLKKFITEWFSVNKISLPKWQRDDCWDNLYRISLIESIMTNTDLPKFYLSKIDHSEYFYLIDGGHRTRTILKYMKNEFPIKIDGIHVYYSESPESLTKIRIMKNNEKHIFDNYLLSFTIYENLTQKESRELFNKLQNSMPMTIADLVNSVESPLIDYLREMGKFAIEGQFLSKYFEDHKNVLGKPGNSNLLFTIASWWSICFPVYNGKETNDDKALNYVLRGEKRDSPCFHYIKEYMIDVTNEEKSRFQEYLTYLIKQVFILKENNHILTVAEMSSLLHAKVYLEKFNLSKFIELYENYTTFCEYKKLSKDAYKKQDIDGVNGVKINENNAHIINLKYDGGLDSWKGLKSNCNRNGMKVRYNLIKRYCQDPEIVISNAASILDSFNRISVSDTF